MLRRFVLVGVFVMIEQGSMIQISLGTAFSISYMMLQVQAGPYAKTSDNYLANGCSFALSIFFVVSIIFKMGTLTAGKYRYR